MSLYGYRESQELAQRDWGFDSLIMAAMRKADSDNLDILRGVFPEIWQELRARYNAPGGMLAGEADAIEAGKKARP